MIQHTIHIPVAAIEPNRLTVLLRQFPALLLLVVLMSLSEIAHAEHGCQDGFIPINQGGGQGQACVADYNLPYWNEGEQQQEAGPTQHWQKTWGGVAIDGVTGEVGTSVGKTTQAEAKNAALTRCSELGGRNCEFALTYRNQCVAIAWPSVLGGRPTIQSGPTTDEAATQALPRCAAGSPGKAACRIVHSECTEPVLVQ